MNRIDNSKYLLYIEPKASEKLKDPIIDEYTKMMEYALSKSKKGVSKYSDREDDGTWRSGSGFKGIHRTECGEHSSNNDFLLENGMITNSLAPFYLKYYRYSIPESEMNKVKELYNFYKNKVK